MYQKAYGIIETLAPLHVGASAGEESGNLNLIFRDQFTQTGIIPGSSIRGRFRADMRLKRQHWLEKELRSLGVEVPEPTQQEIVELVNGKEKKLTRLQWLEKQAKEKSLKVPQNIDENYWYGNSADGGDTTEALVKFEYASLLWLPVFCPGQPIVWISCPRLLKRYQQITGIAGIVPSPENNSEGIMQYPVKLKSGESRSSLFFNLGQINNLMTLPRLDNWMPIQDLKSESLLVVQDKDMNIIHDMALYRQTRTKLHDEVKKVENFFGFEALPEGSILVFPAAIKDYLIEENKEKQPKIKPTEKWLIGLDQTIKQYKRDFYFGGLESIGCGRCQVTLQGEYFSIQGGK